MLPFDDEPLGDLLRRSFAALDAYREDLVLIGGLVPLLYRFLPDYRDPGIQPCATMDVDLAVETVLPIRQDRGVRQALEQAGLHVIEVPGIGRGGGQQYYQLEPDGRLQAEHLEFLVPLRGPDRDQAARPQPGLMAQALRFIDLLRARPIHCPVPGLGTVLLPHPLTYVVQKTRIRQDRRKQGKHRKDQADVAFVVWAFAANWSGWRSLRRELEDENPTWAKWIRDTVHTWRLLYLEPDGPGSGEVAAAFDDAGLTADADLIRRVMTDFITTIEG